MVSALSAWTFGTEDGASFALALLRDLVAGDGVRVHDAATLSWEADAPVPRICEAPAFASAGSPGAEFWGLLFGLTYAVPLIEAAVGRIGEEPAAGLGRIGVDQTFTHKLRDRLVPGSSALLVLSDESSLERLRVVLDAVDGPEMTWVPVVLGDDHREPPDAVPPTTASVSG